MATVAKKLKYRKGAQVETVIAAVLTILDGRPMYFGSKVMSPVFWDTSTIDELRLWSTTRRLWFAVKNDG